MPDGGHNEIAVRPTHDVAAFEEQATALHDEAAERAVLASLLIAAESAPSVWRRVSAIVAPTQFYNPSNALIFEAFGAIIERGEPLDILTASAELRRRERLNTVGGAQYLGELTDEIPTLAHCETHARLVASAWVRRELGTIGVGLARAAASGRDDPMHLRDRAIDALRKLRFGTTKAAGAEDLLTEMWVAIEEGRSGTKPGPLPFYVGTLDDMSGGGMKRGGTYFIAARPGIGKTALACQIGGATAEAGERVLYVALEPKRIEIMQSTAANRAGVSLTKITRAPKTLTPDEQACLTVASQGIATWPLHVIDEGEHDRPDTVSKIEATMRAVPSMPALVIVDHLLKLTPTGRYSKPHEGTAEVVAGLVSLGKRTGATVLVLCHIGRGVSGRDGLFRRPRAEDIAGGDAMNRDADGILLLHREDKYPTHRENVENPAVFGQIDVLAPKLRGVADNTFGRMRFIGNLQRFEALTPSDAFRGDAE